jgi:hypothetical protein
VGGLKDRLFRNRAGLDLPLYPNENEGFEELESTISPVGASGVSLAANYKGSPRFWSEKDPCGIREGGTPKVINPQGFSCFCVHHELLALGLFYHFPI